MTTATPEPTRDLAGFGEISDAGWGTVEALTRALRVRAQNLQATLDSILQTAVRSVPDTDFAGINLLQAGRFAPQVVLGEAPNALDALQQRLNDGPCIEASRSQHTIRIDDMVTDSRWPEYAQLAASLGVRTMLCLPLWVDDERLGSISLYSTSAAPYGIAQERTASLLAIQAAVTLAEATRLDQLGAALRNRDVIGQAKGVLMERFRISADAAFDLLAVASQRANRKLSAIAEDVATTGSLPG